MTLICIQAGHYPRTSGATGAPGEQELTWRITNRLDDLLITRGFQVQIVGADPKDSEIAKDYNLFISLHGEADTHNADGGMISPPDPSVDAASSESKRISQAIESVYFSETGILNRPEWITPAMKFYYMWKRLTAKTPCVILEMGVVQNAHDKVILADTDRVAIAIAKGICKAFNVVYEQPIPTPPLTPVEPPSVIYKGYDLTKVSQAKMKEWIDVEGLLRQGQLISKDEANSLTQTHLETLKSKLRNKMISAKDKVGSQLNSIFNELTTDW